ncbi:MAG: LON peptidase substrate-binding domain-containing protein [Nocardioides sp.]
MDETPEHTRDLPGDITLPMFPLNSVLFPTMSVPLHVFEDRYRALVTYLLAEPDPALRVFGSVAIREGYEVGEHGKQELHRVGCRLQITEATAHPDGSYDILTVARDRFRLNRLETGGPFPIGVVSPLIDQASTVPQTTIDAASTAFAGYRTVLTELRADPLSGALPRDPVYLAWVLAAAAPLIFPDRQALLEETDPAARLAMVTELFANETRAMSVIPSLPATDVARTGWSPN